MTDPNYNKILNGFFSRDKKTKQLERHVVLFTKMHKICKELYRNPNRRFRRVLFKIYFGKKKLRKHFNFQ